MTIDDPAAPCVDLRDKFGREYREEFEPSYLAERPEFRGCSAVWLRILPCCFSHIYPFGGARIAQADDVIRAHP